MSGLMLGALIGGLTGSPHCVGMCGGFSVAASDSPTAYHLGRLFTYVVLGGLAGAFGAAIPGPPWVLSVVSAVLLVGFSLRLAGLIQMPHMPSGRLVELGRKLIGKEGWTARMALGATTALLPCGLVWAAMGLAVGGAGVAEGALIMASFWVGTVPLLAAFSLGLHRLGQQGPRVRMAMAAVVLIAGLGSIAQRSPAPDAEPGDPPHCHDDG